MNPRPLPPQRAQTDFETLRNVSKCANLRGFVRAFVSKRCDLLRFVKEK